MHLKSLAIAGSAVFLAACSNGSGGSDGPDFSETLAVADTYTPVFEDGVTQTADALSDDAVGGGLTGFMGLRDGSLVAVRVRISEDGNTAYISIDGGDEQVMSSLVLSYGGNGGRWTDGVEVLTLRLGTLEARAELDGTQEGAGQFGLRTPVADLPTGTVTYAGQFVLYDQSSADTEGYLALNVDFDSGDVGGQLIGTTESAASDTAIAGTITGEMIDGLFVGVANSTGGVTFELDMIGGVYHGGEALNGAMAGTLAGVTVGGEFDTDISGGDL